MTKDFRTPETVRVSDLSYAYTVPANTTCPATPAGRPTDVRHAVTDALTTKTTSYCYDTVGRLTSASTPGGATYAYGFDANTNRTSGPEGTHTVNSGDQLTDTGFSYNADGNLTAGGSHSALTYNGIGQTSSITTAGATTGYSYAGGGQTERTTAGPTTALHSLLGLVTETTAGAGSSYLREASGALIAERTPVGDFYYVRDGLGSVIALVDATGTQRAADTYDPYGDHATAAGVNGALPPNPWRWNASYLDSDGLYKMGARYYDPGLGRFTQADPVEGGSANGYDYVCGDPINQFDVAGTWCIGSHCIHAPKTATKFVDKALDGCSYACITSVGITTVVGLGVTGGICGASLGAGCVAAAAGTGAAVATVKHATSKHSSQGLGCAALTGGAGGAVTGGTGDGGKVLKYAGKAVAHEIGAKTPC